MRLQGIAFAVLLGGVGGVAAACTLELDGSISCGDGYVDREAGEQCDPGVTDSFIDACTNTARPNGLGACDPVTCEVLNDLAQCGRCGDGIVDSDSPLFEECDGDNLNGARCPSGSEGLQCVMCKFDDTLCDQCGDGERDPGEECDFREFGPDDVVQPKLCRELIAPSGREYTFGQTARCNPGCRFDRGSCSYCGNEQLDPSLPVDISGPDRSEEEKCDGDLSNEEERFDFCTQRCADGSGRTFGCDAVCSVDCLGFSLADSNAPMCCLAAGERCPTGIDPIPCCFAVENPGMGNGCESIFTPEGQVDLCR